MVRRSGQPFFSPSRAGIPSCAGTVSPSLVDKSRLHAVTFIDNAGIPSCAGIVHPPLLVNVGFMPCIW